MKLISSGLALRALLVLSPDNQLSLAGLSRALEAPPSSAQGALRLLIADGLATAKGRGRGRTYRMTNHSAISGLLDVAIAILPVEEALRLAGRAHAAVEFVALAGSRVLVVFAKLSNVYDSSGGARLIELIADRAELSVEYAYHDDLRREVFADPDLRCRTAAMRILHGSLDRTYPDRSAHGDRNGQPLGRMHPQLKFPSRRTVGLLKRRHGLKQLGVFGSAVRSDFRPDSDVDVLVSFDAEFSDRDKHLDEIGRELEAATGRDVEIVEESLLRPMLRPLVMRELVLL
ncbi:MAG: nucleotidyltransferase family protein [Candidatus Dormibacteraceae bacterium]